jgi:hypothetical protein
MAVALSWFVLRWPREDTPEQILDAIRLLATMAGVPLVIETTGSRDAVTHRLALSLGRADNVVQQLRGALPGLAIEEVDAPVADADRAIELRLTTKRRPLRSDDLGATNRALLTALADLKPGESLILQWVLGRSLRPIAVPNRLEGVVSDSWVKDAVMLPLGKSIPVDGEVRNALRTKQGEPGWRAAGRIAVHAKSNNRQRQLIRQVLAALRSTESPGLAFWVRSLSPRAVTHAQVPWRLPLRLNATELAALSTWPVGLTSELPVAHQRSRLLAPSPVIPKAGRIIGEASFPGKERPLGISPDDSRRHSHLIGPSGVGKSTLLGRLIAGDMAAGRAVVVIEPKSDLIADVLAHVPPERIGDVVLLDPTDELAPVGLNPLSGNKRHPELVADQLLAVFKGMYGATFGPRTTDIAGAALHTLAQVPNMTLAALPLILSDASFRRRIVRQIDDPIALGPFWAAFENWSDAERTAAVAPLLNKARPFLLRPQLRAVIGQARPRFDVLEVFTKRRILLVDCSKGLLGPEAAALLGSLVLAQVWGATLSRSAIAPERRHPVTVVLDEFQEYLRLPGDLGDALAQARGLGVGFTLAHQYLHQLETPMRSAVLANAQNRICFRLADEDARVMASPGSRLEAEDFSSLDAYEFYAQLVAQGSIQPWCSGRSLPPDAPISDPEVVRTASRANYGTDRGEVEAELRDLVFGRSGSSGDDLTPRRRRDGGRS